LVILKNIRPPGSISIFTCINLTQQRAARLLFRPAYDQLPLVWAIDFNLELHAVSLTGAAFAPMGFCGSKDTVHPTTPHFKRSATCSKLVNPQVIVHPM